VTESRASSLDYGQTDREAVDLWHKIRMVLWCHTPVQRTVWRVNRARIQQLKKSSIPLFVYMVMATSSAVFLIWRIKIADVVAVASAPIGAAFTAVALLTGSFWGKPMWGTWWIWDDKPSMHISMLRPLLIMVLSFQMLYFFNLMIRVRTLILEREARAAWVADLAGTQPNG